MIGTPQDPEDLTRMAAMPSVIRMAMGDPHAARTVPLGPAPEPITMAPGGPAAPDMPQMAPQKVNSPASLPGVMAKTQDRLMADYSKDENPYGSANNHPGFLGKILHGLNVATGGENRRLWEEQGLQKQVEDQAGLQSKLGQEEAQTRNLNTEADLAPGKAASEESLQGATVGNLKSETSERDNPRPTFAVHDTEDGPLFINNQTGAAQHISVDGQPVGPKLQLKESQPVLGPDGKPHTYMLDDKGRKVVDLGVHYEKPIINQMGENHEFAEQERGRGLLDKAETQYRTAQQGANGLRDMIAQADAGNKVSAQVLPLQGALEITTAQGVHRINRTEVDQYAGAGSLWDKVAGELGKVTSGQPIPANIRQDMRKLADVEERAAYQNYIGAHQSAVKRYNLQGEEPLPEPGGGQSAQPQRPANVPQGYKYNASGPKGAGWYAPTAK